MVCPSATTTMSCFGVPSFGGCSLKFGTVAALGLLAWLRGEFLGESAGK